MNRPATRVGQARGFPPVIDSELVGSTDFSESRRCLRDTYPESYISPSVLVYEDKLAFALVTGACCGLFEAAGLVNPRVVGYWLTHVLWVVTHVLWVLWTC